MLVNVTHVEETRVAILNQGVLESYEIETINRHPAQGQPSTNALVENVHSSLDAAFLKISPDTNGFYRSMRSTSTSSRPWEGRKGSRIGQHLHNSQRLMAQVVREPFAGKPPTVSTLLLVGPVGTWC